MNTTKPKVIFINELHPYLIMHLRSLGYQCDEHYNTSTNDIASIIHQYTGIVIKSRIELSRVLIDKASKLKFVARAGAGLESIDTNYLHKKGIRCFSSPEGNRDAVAEHALGMLLCLMNKLRQADAEVRKGLWNREINRGYELKGKTIGIIGYGNMGRAFAQRLQGFDVEVIAYDKYKTNYGDAFAKAVDLSTLQSKADVISLHIPYSKDNHYFVNDDFLASCKKNIYLINTARGKVLNTNDLITYLKKNKVLGACLDVLEYEGISFEEIYLSKQLPEAFKYITQSEKVMLSPHIAGWTQESKYKHAEALAHKIEKAFGKASNWV